MMQQTRSLDGYVMNGWPYPAVEVVPEVWSGLFKYDDTSTFEADIEWLSQTGITQGCNPPANDQFCPLAPVTRGQMASFLRRAFSQPFDFDRWLDSGLPGREIPHPPISGGSGVRL